MFKVPKKTKWALMDGKWFRVLEYTAKSLYLEVPWAAGLITPRKNIERIVIQEKCPEERRESNMRYCAGMPRRLSTMDKLPKGDVKVYRCRGCGSFSLRAMSRCAGCGNYLLFFNTMPRVEAAKKIILQKKRERRGR